MAIDAVVSRWNPCQPPQDFIKLPRLQLLHLICLPMWPEATFQPKDQDLSPILAKIRCPVLQIAYLGNMNSSGASVLKTPEMRMFRWVASNAC